MNQEVAGCGVSGFLNLFHGDQLTHDLCQCLEENKFVKQRLELGKGSNLVFLC